MESRKRALGAGGEVPGPCKGCNPVMVLISWHIDCSALYICFISLISCWCCSRKLDHCSSNLGDAGGGVDLTRLEVQGRSISA